MEFNVFVSQLPWLLARLAVIIVPAVVVAKSVARTKASAWLWLGVGALAVNALANTLYTAWIPGGYRSLASDLRLVVGNLYQVFSLLLFGAGVAMLVVAAAAGRAPASTPSRPWQGQQPAQQPWTQQQPQQPQQIPQQQPWAQQPASGQPQVQQPWAQQPASGQPQVQQPPYDQGRPGW